MLPKAEPLPRSTLGLQEDDFVVHFAFDMHSWPQRKNPIGAIRAFQLAFEGDSRAFLFLKIRNGGSIGRVDSDSDDLGSAVLELAQQDERIMLDLDERVTTRPWGFWLRATCTCRSTDLRASAMGLQKRSYWEYHWFARTTAVAPSSARPLMRGWCRRPAVPPE